ncbi:HU family DNA-binding protein [Bacteroides sp. UBA939]|uniref:HU family DNA-binding protein n=1 Tax=Bacteroides sp. UBA939 TaxID=1946092 RepID=UPI0025BA7187|nr:HU family DNA-binding protein [Bacteroides sp. UBA939]
MAVPFKKTVHRKDLRDKQSPLMYYPRLVTMGQSANLESIAYEMKEKSSLSLGDIKSVLTNFVEAMRTALYNGHSVNIQDFGVFSLSARTVGTETEKECTAKNIKSVRINFRPSTSVKPNLTSTRAGEKIEFLDIKAAVEGSSNSDEDNSTGGNSGDGGIDDNPLG